MPSTTHRQPAITVFQYLIIITLSFIITLVCVLLQLHTLFTEADFSALQASCLISSLLLIPSAISLGEISFRINFKTHVIGILIPVKIFFAIDIGCFGNAVNA